MGLLLLHSPPECSVDLKPKNKKVALLIYGENY
jgi:hypothetical protein